MAQRTISKPAPSQIKPAGLRTFHASLAAWYATHGRHDLPWRNTADPYHIWLSEVMLQQTQVATVRERFYFPFLEKFPTIEALAAAPRESVMKAWEGLGYYRRAGNLHEAAKIISGMSPRRTTGSRLATQKKNGPRHEDEVTDWSTLDDLLALPGIGKNTAHAILAFAYYQPVAILEANVKRVVARMFALETPSEAELWAGAEMLLNKAAPFDYNQAMMDVGSLICTPKNPRCTECPAQKICAGIASPEKYPAPKLKKQTPTREVTIHVREDARGRLFLEKREEALLGGLYGFPQTQYTLDTQRHIASHGEPRSGGVSEAKGQRAPSILGLVTHIYSHFKLIGTVVHERIASKPNSPDWHTAAEIAALPLSKLDHKVLALVENCHSAKKKPAKA
jgi:A/G-specific adenine glycosylase